MDHLVRAGEIGEEGKVVSVLRCQPPLPAMQPSDTERLLTSDSLMSAWG